MLTGSYGDAGEDISKLQAYLKQSVIHSDAGPWCWIDNRSTVALVWRFFAFYVWMWVATAYNAWVYFKVFQALKRGIDQNSSSEATAMMKRMRFYPLVLVVAYFFGFFNRLYELFGSSLAMYCNLLTTC
jgi:hypothetical protein